jgi:ribosomal protein S3
MSYIEDQEEKIIHIYTKYPGYFIGKAGETIFRYREIVNRGVYFR